MTETNWRLLWDDLPASVRASIQADPRKRLSIDECRALRKVEVELGLDDQPTGSVSLLEQFRGQFLTPKFQEWIESLPTA